MHFTLKPMGEREVFIVFAEEVLKQIQPMNTDEQFYKEYFLACRSEAKKKRFLSSLNREDVVRRHLVVPEMLPDIISYNMGDDEYFHKDDRRSVCIVRHNRYTPAFLHKHAFFEIVVVVAGRCVQTIGLQNLQFQAGDVIFIAPGTFHTMEVFDDTGLVFNILLRRSTFYQMFTPLTMGDDLLSEFFSEGLYDTSQVESLVFHTQEQGFVVQQILELYGEQMQRDSYTDQILVGTLTAMIARMMRSFKGDMECLYSGPQTSQPEDFMVMNYIQEHLADVTLADVAEHFGFSVSYCSRLIKASTGQGFNDWKRTLRLHRAEHLLINTGKSVAEISGELGYTNVETFIRAFKKGLHMTPAQYRKHRRS